MRVPDPELASDVGHSGRVFSLPRALMWKHSGGKKKKTPTSLQLWSNLFTHLPINFISKVSGFLSATVWGSYLPLSDLAAPAFRLNMLSFNEILFSVSSCYWDTWKKAVSHCLCKKPTRLTPEGSRSKMTVKQYLANWQNFTLGIWIFEDFELQRQVAACTPLDHPPSQHTLVLCGWCGLCVYTGVFQRPLPEQPHLPLL